jgi:hypothetical protein
MSTGRKSMLAAEILILFRALYIVIVVSPRISRNNNTALIGRTIKENMYFSALDLMEFLKGS